MSFLYGMVVDGSNCFIMRIKTDRFPFEYLDTWIDPTDLDDTAFWGDIAVQDR